MKIIDEYLNRLYKDDNSKEAEVQNKAIEQFDDGNDENSSI